MHQLRIAVIADTHDELPRSLPKLLSTAHEIWHLGDVCDPRTLKPLNALNIPLTIIAGNNDTYPWPHSLNLTRLGHTFHLVHIPPFHSPLGAKFILHGHTHIPRDETDPLGTRWLNPGAITAPRSPAGPTFAWLTLSEATPPDWHFIQLP